MSTTESAGPLRTAALVSMVAGAVGSVASTLYVGRRNASWLLMIVFVVWVLSPFVGLGIAEASSKAWSVRARAKLHRAMLLAALGSLAVYGYVALGPSRAQPAFAFLMTPLGSWVLIALTEIVSRRQTAQNQGR